MKLQLHNQYNAHATTDSSTSRFNGKPEYFVYRAFIASTEIIILLLLSMVPF